MKNYYNIPEKFLVFKEIIIDKFKENYIDIYNNIQKYKDIKNKKQFL